MSILSKLIGKIPVVGGALNKVGKVLPSAGQLLGGAALGPLGASIAGHVDPSASATQRGIGDAVAAGTGAVGLGSLAGLPLGGLTKGVAGLAGGGTGGLNLGSLLDGGLGAAGLVNAAQLAGKSDKYADTAYHDVRDSFDKRAALRDAGTAGMLNPGAGVPLKLANVQANTGRGNPFAVKPKSPGVSLA